jgi:hypothetical protein
MDAENSASGGRLQISDIVLAFRSLSLSLLISARSVHYDGFYGTKLTGFRSNIKMDFTTGV